MIGAISVFPTRAALFPIVIGIIGAMSAATVTTPSQAQQSNDARAVAAPTPARPVSKNLNSTATPANSPRRKRGGPDDTPGSDINATPVEGQSDLINVLQPKLRQTAK